METINVTCPADGTRFAVVEPENQSTPRSLTAACPVCKERFAIVYPDELYESKPTRSTSVPYKNEEIVEWELRTDGPMPYTGSEKEIPFEQYVIVTIRGIGGDLYGGDWEEEGPIDDTAVSGQTDRFQIWYTPDHRGDNHEQIAYVIRADLETGVKTKNVYKPTQGSNLYVKNRGVPRDSDKKWTYLDRDECTDRLIQAQLDGEISESEENRYNIFLNHDKQPLVDERDEIADELVKELGRMLIAFQTKRVE